MKALVTVPQLRATSVLELESRAMLQPRGAGILPDGSSSGDGWSYARLVPHASSFVGRDARATSAAKPESRATAQPRGAATAQLLFDSHS